MQYNVSPLVERFSPLSKTTKSFIACIKVQDLISLIKADSAATNVTISKSNGRI